MGAFETAEPEVMLHGSRVLPVGCQLMTRTHARNRDQAHAGSRAPCSVALQGLGGELRAKNSCMYFGEGCVTGGRGIVRERRKSAIVGGPELLDGDVPSSL